MDRQKHQSGHTLFELLVVIAVIFVIMAVGGTSFDSAFRDSRGHAAAGKIGEELRIVRSKSLNQEQAQVFEFDIKTRNYRRNANADWTPIDNSLAVQIRSASPSADDILAIIFYPDGSSSGGEFFIGSEIHRWRVKVGVDGKVSIDREVESQSAK